MVTLWPPRTPVELKVEPAVLKGPVLLTASLKSPFRCSHKSVEASGPMWQSASHPSPLTALPSSHSSPAVRIPFRHPVTVQFVSQPSPSTALPSSHCSEIASTVPLPQTPPSPSPSPSPMSEPLPSPRSTPPAPLTIQAAEYQNRATPEERMRAEVATRQ